MTEATKSVLTSLIAINGEDAILLRIFSEKKALEQEFAQRKAEIVALERDCHLRELVVKEKRILYDREEKKLRDERTKLTDRRKAVESLSGYKLQEAAGKEIDFAAEQLDKHEESTIEFITQMEDLEKALAEAKAKLLKMKEALAVFDEDAKGTLENFALREKDHKEARDLLVAQLDPTNKSVYERIKEKYPGQCVVEINGATCTGCHMQAGAQMLVAIHKGESLIKCRGCGRILYLPNTNP